MKTDFRELARAKKEEMQRLRAIDKCYVNKQQYRKAKVLKLRNNVSRESKLLNPPKNRFVISTPKEQRKPYKVDTNRWRILEKPQEWARIRNTTIRKTKVLNGSLKS